ncbi:MAG: hypothetical protein KAS32_26435, partial [Candidatus Peribacteraceae bacterium]|nr:hypothetical protein [Candidatus Peribacteraceae bacterium]
HEKEVDDCSNGGCPSFNVEEPYSCSAGRVPDDCLMASDVKSLMSTCKSFRLENTELKEDVEKYICRGCCLLEKDSPGCTRARGGKLCEFDNYKLMKALKKEMSKEPGGK